MEMGEVIRTFKVIDYANMNNTTYSANLLEDYNQPKHVYKEEYNVSFGGLKGSAYIVTSLDMYESLDYKMDRGIVTLDVTFKEEQKGEWELPVTFILKEMRLNQPTGTVELTFTTPLELLEGDSFSGPMVTFGSEITRGSLAYWADEIAKQEQHYRDTYASKFGSPVFQKDFTFNIPRKSPNTVSKFYETGDDVLEVIRNFCKQAGNLEGPSVVTKAKYREYQGRFNIEITSCQNIDQVSISNWGGFARQTIRKLNEDVKSASGVLSQYWSRESRNMNTYVVGKSPNVVFGRRVARKISGQAERSSSDASTERENMNELIKAEIQNTKGNTQYRFMGNKMAEVIEMGRNVFCKSRNSGGRDVFTEFYFKADETGIEASTATTPQA